MTGEVFGKDELKKPIGDLHSVPHYRCPTCKRSVKLFDEDAQPAECPWCKQKLKWEDEHGR